MVTKWTSVAKEVINSGGWITPSPSLVTDEDGRQKRARQSDSIGPHVINHMGMEDGSKFMEVVESVNDKEGFDVMASSFNTNYHILIPQLSFQKSIISTDNLGTDPAF